jgi:hypothetical protein
MNFADWCMLWTDLMLTAGLVFRVLAWRNERIR